MKLQSGIYLIIAMVATAAIMHDEGLSKLATRAPFGMMDFYLANMRTLCARAVAEEEWTCTLTCEGKPYTHKHTHIHVYLPLLQGRHSVSFSMALPTRHMQKQLTHFYADLWRDPNWSNNTAPECKKTYKWDGERADFAEKLSMCWRDTDNPRNLPAFQHSIKSFTTPGNFTLSLVDHVVDQE